MSPALAASEPRAAYLATRQSPLLRHFDLLAQSTDGVARLRELILSLAVQGKLVPQDPNDEPASVLLERIRAEKARLIAEGQIKNDKPLPEITDDEQPFNLPIGWQWARCGNYLIDLCTGPFGSVIHKEDYIFGGVPLVNPSHMANGTISHDPSVSVSLEAACRLSAYRLSAGDIVLARRGEVGRYALVSTEQDGWLCGTGSFFAKFHSLCSREFMGLVFRESAFRAHLQGKSVGSTMTNLNQRILLESLIAIPPSSEQVRIAARVEELMALCDALEEKGRLEAAQHERLVSNLFDTLASSESAHALAENWQRIAAHFDLLLDRPEAVDALEQTILQLAVRGLLVPQDTADEPASVLLQKIRSDKDRLIAEGKIKRDKAFPSIGNDKVPFELPGTWEWARFGDLIESSEAGWSPSCTESPRRGEGWGVLKISAVSWGEFRSFDNKELPIGLEPRPEYEVRPGDFLLSRANTEELVARSVIARNPEPRLMLSDKLIRLHISALADCDYMNLCNNSRLARSYYVENASGTSSSMKNVSREVILALPVPLPPIAEQSRIVARVTELRGLCAELRKRLAAARQTQSHLAKALVETVAAST